MADRDINVLLTTFAGLGLPRTLSLSFHGSTTIGAVADTIFARLPPINHPLTITTTANQHIQPTHQQPLSTLIPDHDSPFLPLRLSAQTLGGKGGFGSQLRAAGGRMSSRKKRNANNEPANGSNRNLDGRRLRTVDAAKKLADYLTKKPEMEEKEKAERRKRWETVVDMAEKREEEIKSGKAGAASGRLDAEYVESKEIAEDKTREAVIQAMRGARVEPVRTGSESSIEVVDEESDERDVEESSDSSAAEVREETGTGKAFFGWDEDDEDDDDDEEDGESGSK